MLNIFKLKKSNIKNDITIKKNGEYVKTTNYYPPYSREWYNSVYTFNKNTIKILPNADVYVSKIIKAYFNLFSNKLEKKARVYNTLAKNRIAKVNRIFVGKPEFKHTNDKVIITLYIYNAELISYVNKLKKLRGLNFFNMFETRVTKTKIKHNKPKLHIIKDIYIKFFKQINILNTKYLNKINYSFFNIDKFIALNLIKKMVVKLKLYLHVKKIMHLNRSKFNSIHILFLRNSLRKIYGKNVEFNIVNLKRYHLNSSILTQIIAIKLKREKSKLALLIKNVLNKLNLPYKEKLEIPWNTFNDVNKQNLIVRNQLNNNYVKKIPNVELYVNSLGSHQFILNKVFIKKVRDDKLNNYLKSLYPKQYLINLSNEKEIYIKSRNLENTVLDNIKNKVISGIRIKSSGRLTKRITGRAVSIMKQTGTIKNVYSSYRGVSSVLLRGNLRHNVDFTKSDYVGNTGSFGLKGWIGSM